MDEKRSSSDAAGVWIRDGSHSNANESKPMNSYRSEGDGFIMKDVVLTMPVGSELEQQQLDAEVLVIGAGAAGLAAARTLREAGKSVLVIEVRSRAGGRVHSLMPSDRAGYVGEASGNGEEQTVLEAEFPIELGAEFIHGENTTTRKLVEEFGLSVIPVVRMDRLHWFDESYREETRFAVERKDLKGTRVGDVIDRLLKAYHELEHEDEQGFKTKWRDASLADYLRGRGFSEDELKIGDVLLAQTCCARLDRLSCDDLRREMIRDQAGVLEFRIKEGRWIDG